MVPVWMRCILEERPTSGILCTRWVPPSCFSRLYTFSPAILAAAWCRPPEGDRGGALTRQMLHFVMKKKEFLQSQARVFLWVFVSPE